MVQRQRLVNVDMFPLCGMLAQTGWGEINVLQKKVLCCASIRCSTNNFVSLLRNPNFKYMSLEDQMKFNNLLKVQ